MTFLFLGAMYKFSYLLTYLLIYVATKHGQLSAHRTTAENTSESY